MEQSNQSNQNTASLKPDSEGSFFQLKPSLKVEFKEFSTQWTRTDMIDSRHEIPRKIEQENNQHFNYNPNIYRGSELPR